MAQVNSAELGSLEVWIIWNLGLEAAGFGLLHQSLLSLVSEHKEVCASRQRSVPINPPLSGLGAGEQMPTPGIE